MTQSKQSSVEVITAYNGCLLIPSGNDCIGNVLKNYGKFETDDIKRVGEYLDNLRNSTSKRQLFADIGANIGTHSISALKEHGYAQLLAVEPSEQNHRLLTANLCLNGLITRATCVQAAASEHEGIGILFHNPDNCGDYRLEYSPQGLIDDRLERREQVRTINVYSLLSKHLQGIDPEDALCWIDTQGHEIPILRSLKPLVNRGVAVVMEFWPYGMEQQEGTFDQLAACLDSPLLQIANITNDAIKPMGLDELKALWTDLRAADTGTPEGASYSDILIYTVAKDLSIHPQEEERIAMTLRCKDSQAIPKVPSAGRVIQHENGSYQVMHNGLKVIQGGYYGAWMCKLIEQLEGHHEPQEEIVFHEINKRAANDGLMIELGCYWAYYSLWFLKDRPQRQAIGVEPDANHLIIAEANARLNQLEHQFTVLHGLSSASSNESIAISTESGEELKLRGYTLEELLCCSKHSMVEIAHCDAQGAESHVVDQVITLGKHHRLRFCIISTHAYEITGDPLTHHTCLDKLRAAGAHIIAEHDVHESFSGDGLIAASFCDDDKDLVIKLSCNRYSTSLFPNPAYHLSEALKQIESLKNEPNRAQAQQYKLLSKRQRIKQAFADVLSR